MNKLFNQFIWAALSVLSVSECLRARASLRIFRALSPIGSQLIGNASVEPNMLLPLLEIEPFQAFIIVVRNGALIGF